MQALTQAEAIAGAGLKGDRYAEAAGSFNKDNPGKRQVTLINQKFFASGGFTPIESRRNIVTSPEVELLYCVGREFTIGTAKFKGVKYCDPCDRPSKLAGKACSFKEAFLDCGCIIAEILESGTFSVGTEVITPPKGY
jgi:MOSC domain-containing protein YiiM